MTSCAEVEPRRRTAATRRSIWLFRRAGALGLLGLTVPEADGGGGLDATAAVIVHESLSTADPGFALAYLAHSVLFVNNFYRNASPAQHRRFLPATLSGESIGGMCMTEPEAGTDVLGMRTTARRDGDHYLLDGRKTFITNGGRRHAGRRVSGLRAHRGRSISVGGGEGHRGFSLGRYWQKLGVRASMTTEQCSSTAAFRPTTCSGPRVRACCT
jgi:isovaleryl-CoA dehydrogenase